MSSTRSETGSEEVSLYGSDNDFEADGAKIAIRITSENDLSEIYNPVFQLIGADTNFLDLQPLVEESVVSENVDHKVAESSTGNFNSIALLIFLHEEGMLGCERIQNARRLFENAPWTFHHSEDMQKRTTNPYPYNSQEFYSTANDLPLWAVRQVHYGKEHLRVMLFVSDENWYDMLGFYKIILAMEPELQRHDFCLYSVTTYETYDVQFALKRRPGTIRPKKLDRVRLMFSVSQIGQMVPLFPNPCQPQSDTKWLTVDHDGNTIILNISASSQTHPSPNHTSRSFVRNGSRTRTMNGFYV